MRASRWTVSGCAWVARRHAAALMAGLLAAGCSGDRQEGAYRELHDLGYKFEVADYLRAAAEGRDGVVDAFHDAGMAVDAADHAGSTALLRAAYRGHASLVATLLKRGADAKRIGPGGESPLLAAARSGDLDTVNLLLSSGADATVKDDEGWAPLTLAAFEGNARAVAVLAPRSRDLLDEALQLAAINGSVEVIDILLNSGASVYARSAENQTALMYAASNGHLEVVKLLLRNGANRFAIDNDDRTPADMAGEAGFDEVAAYLSEPPEPVDQSLPPFPRADLADMVPDVQPEMLPVVTESGDLAEFSSELGAPPADGPGPAGPRLGVAASAVMAPPPPRLKGTVVRAQPSSVLKNESQQAASEPAVVDSGPALRMHDYRELPLPVLLTGVSEDSAAAQVRVLYGGDRTPVEVAPGDEIADTGLKVVKLERRFVYSKQGKGAPVDVSQMIVEDGRTGARHMVVKDIPAKAADTFALLSVGDEEIYDARVNDEFQIVGDAAHRYRVLDVRPTQVIIENTDTGETLTVQRVGIAGQ